MEQVVRNVADIDTADRRALEHVIGRQLAEHQQVIISVVNINPAGRDTPTQSSSQAAPPWANIYEGLSDEEVDRLLDRAIRQRARLTRHFE